MSDQRPLSSYLTTSDYDHPPASITLAENVSTRLDRLRRTLERHREESRRVDEAARHARWGSPPSLRRRRVRPAGSHPLTFEGRAYARSDDSMDEEEARPRSAKRRKLDHHGDSAIDEKSFKYGHYGQVEAGRLKLNVLCSGGGIHDERGPIYYGPGNVIKHDQSVWCSKEPRCHIVLKHHDEKPFCLEKLQIIAPDNGFTAPVKEGLVGVSMTFSELFTMMDTAIGRYSSRQRLSRDWERQESPVFAGTLINPEGLRDAAQHRAGDESPIQGHAELDRLPEDLEVWDQRSPSTSSQTNDGDWPVLEPITRSQHRLERQVREDLELESGIRVTMLSDEDPSWPEEPTTAAVIADRQRRTRIMHMNEEDSQGWDPRFRAAYSRIRRGLRPETHHSSANSRNLVANISKKDSDVVKVPFKMSAGKYKITLKFDPPISGTFIFLELWSLHSGRNVDIQTIIASGWAGPRFFPAVDCR